MLTLTAERAPDLAPPLTRYARPTSDPTAIVVVTRRQIFTQGDRYPIAALPSDPAGGLLSDDKRDGRDDLYVTPLGLSLAWLEARAEAGAQKREIAVLADAKTTYRILFEVLTTAAECGYETASVGARASSELVAIPIAVGPPPSHGNESERDELSVTPPALRVALVADGIIVHVRASGAMLPTTRETIPQIGTDYDFLALRTLLERLKHDEAALRDEATIHLAADPSVALEDIVSAIDAARGDVGSLFPSVQLELRPEAP